MKLANTVSVAARALVPLVGVLALDWSSANVVIVYFADTLASMYAVTIATAGRLIAFDDDGGPAWWRRAYRGLQLAATGAVVLAAIALPLGLSVWFILAQMHVDWSALADDRSLWIGVLAQLAAALTVLIDGYRRLMADPSVDVLIKRRFALVFLRWMAVVAIGYAGLGRMGASAFGPLAIAVYALATIAIELVPGRVLRASDAADLDRLQSPRERARRR